MRNLILITLMLSSFASFSQSLLDCNSLDSCAEIDLPVDEATGACVFQEVIDVPERSADELHQSARVWFAEAYKSSQDVVQLDDPETNVIIGKAWSPLQDRGDRIWYTLKVECKDGRYRYTMYDVEYDSGPGQSARYREYLCQTLMEKRLRKGRRARTDRKYRYAYVRAINSLTDDLKLSMASAPATDDW